MRENKNVSANEAAKALFRVITCQIKFEIFFSSLLLCPVFFYNNPPHKYILFQLPSSTTIYDNTFLQIQLETHNNDYGSTLSITTESNLRVVFILNKKKKSETSAKKPMLTKTPM